MPWCLYMDGVAYSLSDTVLGIWIYNMVTGTRMQIALIRKRIVCACGCRGWCAYWPIASISAVVLRGDGRSGVSSKSARRLALGSHRLDST